MKKINFAIISMCMILVSCNNSAEKRQAATEKIKAGITKTDWGSADGKAVYLFTLTNKNGDEVRVSNYGGTITSWTMPDKNGNKTSIVLGFDSLSGYLAKPPYFGATIGRYGNRIANGKFNLGNTEYTLAQNNGKNSLHGGLKGFDKVVWDASPLIDSIPSLTLHYLSKDGEEGFPGNLSVAVKFSLSDDDALTIEYNAETDKPTPVNLTNHSYFNLSGDVSNTILDETLMINAGHYTPVDTSLIPTGEIKSVKGSPFDFTAPEKIGARIGQVKGGYDHNFVLNRKDSLLDLEATLFDPMTGRKLEVYTTQPGIQFYSGNFLDGSIKTSSGKPINQHAALCLETQHFPDSPNEPLFPSTILGPGEKYHSITEYKVLVVGKKD
ncbi:MAG: galactose mutarotase [Bacteroidetes bacterium]|nr:galactose mutarotase [Bacteroidota bacterium]MBS1973527.1 galactose mutarotase [Bacteroidota bacterium]